METALRRTGVSPMGDMPWSSHICLFYENSNDLLDVLVSYFRAGLESREFCVWAVSEPLSVEQAIHALERGIPGFDEHARTGSMEILPGHEWYLQGGRIDPKRITAGWHEKLQHALSKGYEGMRVSGNAFWIEGKHWKEFCQYEQELDEALADRQLLVLCTYPINATRAVDILDVVRAHQFTLARRDGDWEILETPELKYAKQEIARQSEELEDRVSERTRQLEEANQQLAAQIAERTRAEHKLREAQAELARVVQLTTMAELAASIAHEMNQPLAAIVTNAEASLRWLATRPPNVEEARQTVNRIGTQAERASEVIKRMRALSSKDNQSHAELDVNAVIAEVLDLTTGEREQRQVSVRTDPSPDLPRVLGDRIQLQQVILNLMLNGMEAMNQVTSRPRLLTITSRTDESGNVLITVDDSGVGIDPENADKVFDPFFTTKPHGMGMGLSISRSIIEAHGGRIWASPGHPHGTSIRFTVPALNDDR